MRKPHQDPMAGDVEAPSAASGCTKSMHARVPAWYDCCSCEAEPYWLEAMRDPDLATRPDEEEGSVP